MKKETSYLGIWLDHSKAYLIEPTDQLIEIETFPSGYSKQERTPGEGATGTRLGNYRSSNNEYSTHQRKTEILSRFYKLLGNRIKNYDKVILFGPRTAKEELFNLLLADKEFKKVSLHVAETDKMTRKQMSAFVKKFSDS